MFSYRNILLFVCVACNISARPLADVRGSELIRDTAEDITKHNITEQNEAQAIESAITLSHIQNMITAYGEKAACNHVLTLLENMDSSRSLRCLRTLINEENGLISCLIQQLQMYFTPETVNNDLTCTLESSAHGYAGDAMQCTTRLHTLLSDMATENNRIQNNLPTPAELDSLIHAAFTGYSHCQTIKDIAYRHNFIITSAPTTTYDQLENSMHTCVTLAITNARLLLQLEQQVENIHLRPYNKAYRYTCNTLDKLPKAKIAWTAAAGSLAFLWSLRYMDVEQPWLQSIKRHLHGPDVTPDSTLGKQLSDKIYGHTHQSNTSNDQSSRSPVDRRNLAQIVNSLPQQPQQQFSHQIEQEKSSYYLQALEKEAVNNDEDPSRIYEKWTSHYPLTTFCSNLFGHPIGFLTATANIVYTITSSLNQTKQVENYIPIYATISRKLQEWHHRMRGQDIYNMKQLQYHNNITLDDKRFNTMRETLEPFYRILDYMDNPVKYTHGGLTVPKNILITGPSGCGKSFAAQAFGNSLDKQMRITGHGAIFYELEKSDWININSLGAANAVQEIIAWAKANAPCIIFIDELHTYDLQDNTNSTFLNQLLTGLDHLDLNRNPEEQVFVIGATNRPEKLDPALLRPGRFGTRISLSYPGHEERKNIIQARCEQLSIDLEHTDIDLDYLANLTAGTSLSSIEKLFEQATFNARSDNQPVTLEYFYKALNRIIRNIIPNTSLSEHELSCMSANIAAQSIIQYLHNPEPLDAITICAMNTEIQEVNALFDKTETTMSSQKDHIAYGGLFYRNNNEHLTDMSYEQQKLYCKQLLAGKEGEEFLMGRQSSYREHDTHTAYEKALSIVCDGIPFTMLSQQKQSEKRDEAYTLYNQLRQEVRTQLQQHFEALSQLHAQLTQEQFLHKPAIEKVMTESTHAAA